MGVWSLIFVLNIVQFALMAYSMCYFEPVYNLFFATSGGKKNISDKFFFHLTNFGYLLTVMILCVYAAGYKYEIFRIAYKEALPVVFVIQIIITVVFWILFFKNSTLVIDGKKAPQAWYRHVFCESPKHLIPFLVLFIGILVEQFPALNSGKLIVLFTFILYYWGLCEFYAFTRGRYLYGILSLLNIFQRLMAFLLVMAIAIFLYASLSWLQNIPCLQFMHRTFGIFNEHD